jgi:LysM repeat protein
MQITHETAREFIQFEVDRALTPEKKTALSAHLTDCDQCATYADEINEVEQILSPLIKRQWNRRPVPHSLDALGIKRNSKPQPSTLLTTRKAVVGIILLGFVFSAWQLMGSNSPISGQLPGGVLPVPTPSIESTSTKRVRESCEMRVYTVQGDDTLASIAYRFSVPEDQIIATNQLTSGTVHPTMELMIPICNFTPTGTAAGPTLLTTTYTPLTSPTPSTPGG